MADIQSIIIKYKTNDINLIKRIEERYQLERIYYSEMFSLGNYTNVKNIDELLKELNNLEEIERASKDIKMSSNSYFLDSYHLNNSNGADINWRKAQNYIQKKLPRSEPIIIAIIDNGLSWYDPFFNNDNLAFNNNDPINGIDDDNNGYTDDYLGWDFGENDNDVTPYSTLMTHGDAVTSMILSSIDSNDLSANQNIKILPIKFAQIDNATGEKVLTWSASFQAIEYAIIMGADIINMSYGAVTNIAHFNLFEREIFESLFENDILVICAAGNDGINTNDVVFTPSHASQIFDNVISVGATEESGELWTYQHNGETKGSNFGNISVDITAPGDQVYVYSPLNSTSSLTVYDINLNNDDFLSNWTTGSLTGNSSPLIWDWRYDQNYNLGYIHDGSGREQYAFSLFYERDTHTYLISDWFDLKLITNPFLEIGLFYSLDSQLEDKLYVEATNDDINFSTLKIYGGLYDSYDDHIRNVSLSEYEGQKIKIRIRLETNENIQKYGIRIVSFKIKGESKLSKESGTSLAAPIVAGIAGLMKSLNPELSASDIKNIILNTAKPSETLEDKVASGGLVDSFNSLYAIHNKIKAYHSTDLNNWILLEDFFNDSNEQNYSHYDYDGFKIKMNSDQISSSNNNSMNVILSSKNKTTDSHKTISREIPLDESSFIRIEKY